MFRSLMKLALTFVVTRALTRAGGAGGIIDSVFPSGSRQRGRRSRSGTSRRAH